jgi:hypothetical protein
MKVAYYGKPTQLGLFNKLFYAQNMILFTKEWQDFLIILASFSNHLGREEQEASDYYGD